MKGSFYNKREDDVDTQNKTPITTTKRIRAFTHLTPQFQRKEDKSSDQNLERGILEILPPRERWRNTVRKGTEY
jgi:hypothetical protein